MSGKMNGKSYLEMKFFHPFLTEMEITEDDIAAINAAVNEKIKKGEYKGSLLELFNAVAHAPKL